MFKFNNKGTKMTYHYCQFQQYNMEQPLSNLGSQNFYLKNFLYFFSKNPGMKKAFLIFQEKRFLKFSQKKTFHIFLEMEASKNLYFREWSFPAPGLKNFLFHEMKLSGSNIQKFLTLSQKTAFFIFQETTLTFTFRIILLLFFFFFFRKILISFTSFFCCLSLFS